MHYIYSQSPVWDQLTFFGQSVDQQMNLELFRYYKICFVAFNRVTFGVDNKAEHFLLEAGAVRILVRPGGSEDRQLGCRFLC